MYNHGVVRLGVILHVPLYVFCLTLLATAVYGKVTVELSEVSVTNEKCSGVMSEIYHEDDSDNSVLIGVTNQTGVLSLVPPEPLQRNAMIYAAPKQDMTYFESFRKPVEEKLYFVVVWRGKDKDVDAQLVIYSGLADGYRRRGKDGACPLEIVERIVGIYDQLVYEAVGKKLGIDSLGRYDEAQGKFLVSKELQDAIVKYQSVNGLPATGTWDLSTVNSMVGGRYIELYWEHWRDREVSMLREHGPWKTLPDGYQEYLGRIADTEIARIASGTWKVPLSSSPAVDAIRFFEGARGLRDLGSDGALWLAGVADRESIRAIGEALLVHETVPYDPVMSQYRPGPLTSKQLEVFQRQHGLSVTGRGDLHTLRTLAGEAPFDGGR